MARIKTKGRREKGEGRRKQGAGRRETSGEERIRTDRGGTLSEDGRHKEVRTDEELRVSRVIRRKVE